jgi:hypothetical protein
MGRSEEGEIYCQVLTMTPVDLKPIHGVDHYIPKPDAEEYYALTSFLSASFIRDRNW